MDKDPVKFYVRHFLLKMQLLETDVYAFRADVYALWADVYAFRADVHAFWADVSAFWADVYRCAQPLVFSGLNLRR